MPLTAPLTVSEALRQAAVELAAASPTPRLDAEVLLMHVCGFARSGLMTRRGHTLSAQQQELLGQLLARRLRGEPIAYLTGRREFWSMTLEVTPATLIPRPETELLVEKALARIPPEAAWTVADVGTGGGAVALAIAHERPRCRVLAGDASAAALEVARRNAALHAIANVRFLHGDWLEPFADARLDLIVGNPPYVRADDPHLLEGDVRFEPRRALVGGLDGLDAIRAIARQARAYLKPGGWLLFEHGFDQAAAVADILRAAGYREIACHKDLAGRDRVTACRAG